MISLNIDGSREFAVHYYRWALQQWVLEAEQNFPLLRAVRSRSSTADLQILETLPVGERIEVGHALTKRSHPQALEILGEELGLQEQGWLRARDGQRWRIINRGDALSELEANRKINRSALKKCVREAVEAVLGTDREVWGAVWSYRAEIGRWRIETAIEFRSGDAVMSYHHDIIAGPYRRRMAEFISAPAWLGVGGADWSGLSDADIPNAAAGLAFVCKRFMDEVPNLLPE